MMARNPGLISRRSLLKMLGVGGAAVLVAACQPKEVEGSVEEEVATKSGQAPVPAAEEVKTIRYLGGFGQSWEDFYNTEVLPKFYDLHPNYKVEMTLIGSWPDLYNKIVTSTAGGMPPEVTRQKDFFTPDFIVRGLQQELDEYVAAKAPHIAEDQYVPHAWSNMHWSGKLVALPLLIFNHYPHFNIELYKKAGLVDSDGAPVAPDTWEDVREQANKLKDPSNNVYGTFLRDEGGKEDTVNFFHVWLAQAGGRLIDEEFSRFMFNTPEGLDALTFWVDLIKDGAMKPPGVSIEGIIPQGHVGMWWHASSYWVAYRRDNPDFEWSTAINPMRKTRGAIVRGDHHALFRQSKERDAGFDFLAFHQTPEITLAYGKNQMMIMPRYDVMSDAFYKEPYMGVPGAVYSVEFEQLEQPGNQPQPIFPGYQESSYKIGAQLILACMQEISPEQALDQAEKEANDVLASARRLLGVD